MTSKLKLKQIIERERTNFRKNFIENPLKNLFLGTLGASAVFSLAITYGPSLIDKVENSEYVTNKRLEIKEEKEFLTEVKKAMKNPSNVVWSSNSPILYVDMDGDKKPDAYISYFAGPRGIFGTTIHKITK